MPNGTRRGTTRHVNGRAVHVRSANIRRPQQHRPQLVRSRRRYRHKPVLYAAFVTAGAGAMTALLTGRWGAAFVLVLAAGGLGVTHLVWQHHQRRQALKPAKVRRVRNPETGRKPSRARTLTVAQASAYGPGWKAGDRQCVTHQGAYTDTCATCRASGDRSGVKPKAEAKAVETSPNGARGARDMWGRLKAPQASEERPEAKARIAHGEQVLR